jgi:C_GCAxxG_C_C family probable redox protein
MNVKAISTTGNKASGNLRIEKSDCARKVFTAGSKLAGQITSQSKMKAFHCEIREDEEFCGALTGAIAAIGFLCGEHPRPVPGKNVKKISKEFYRQFHERFGSHYCHDVCGRDISRTEDAVQTGKGKKVRVKTCKHVLTESIDMVAKMLEKNGVHIVR